MGWGDYSDLLVKLRSLCMLMQKMRVFFIERVPPKGGYRFELEAGRASRPREPHESLTEYFLLDEICVRSS